MQFPLVAYDHAPDECAPRAPDRSQRAGAKRPVGEAARRDDEPLSEANCANARRADGSDDAAVRGDHDRAASSVLCDGHASEGRCSRREQERRGDRDEEQQRALPGRNHPMGGRTVGGGRYRLERPLGTAAWRSVSFGHDSELDRPVAVKVLAESLGGARPSGDGSSARPPGCSALASERGRRVRRR